MAPSVRLSAQECLPADGGALLVGRAWAPAEGGPSVIGARGAEAVDLTRTYPTMSHLLNVAGPVDARAAMRNAPALGPIDDIVANSVEGRRDRSKPWLLAPSDLHAVTSDPPSASGGAAFSEAVLVRTAATCRLARLPGRIRPGARPAAGDLYTRASNGSVTLPAAEYDYGGNWASSTGGTHTRRNVN